MPPLKRQRRLNAYGGYVIGEVQTLTEFPPGIESTSRWFYESYVGPRRPVKIAGSCPVDITRFKRERLLETLQYEGELQVERKVDLGFGLGKTRERMTLEEVLKRVETDDSYYLTTQYGGNEEGEDEGEEEADEKHEDNEEEENDEEQEESAPELAFSADFSDTSLVGSFDANDVHDDFDDLDDLGDLDGFDDSASAYTRILELLQPPLTNLYKTSFPLVPPFLSTLIPQQINLWLGACTPHEFVLPENISVSTLGKALPKGNSSGLHHDHQDNLYILVEGRKRFTLYSPADALKLHTVGVIHQIYENGLIDYDDQAWAHVRHDGALVANVAEWKLAQDIPPQERAKYQRVLDSVKCGKSKPDETLDNVDTASADPPSFSKIPPVLCHVDDISDPRQRAKLVDWADKHFPGFLQLQKAEVWLEPGDMLYLPCGWFHEVTSFDSDQSPLHIALNYWFAPPTEPEWSLPYPDAYWANDFQITTDAIAHASLR